jgi:MYXO-CTERM domain-containing protein
MMPSAVFEPIAAATPTGWQLAWESPDLYRSQIWGTRLDLDGMPQQPAFVLGDGFDDREPALVSSPVGPVLLGWHQFVDRTGSVVVRRKVLEQAASVDGGVDGGVDAGVDAGTIPPLADGGLSDGGSNNIMLDPILFQTCGCQSSGAAPLALAFAVFVLARRRRS